MTSRIEEPLKVRIKNDRLLISVGLNTLAHATEYCCRLCNEKNHTQYPYVKVVDKQQLGQEILEVLLDENEAGDTIVRKMLDDAIQDVYYAGSTAIKG